MENEINALKKRCNMLEKNIKKNENNCLLCCSTQNSFQSNSVYDNSLIPNDRIPIPAPRLHKVCFF